MFYICESYDIILCKKRMNWAVGAGVITGSNAKLLTTGTATRAEAVSMIYKYCTKIK